MIWKIFNFVSQKHPINQEHNVFVVLGFQRSGTSLLGQILHTLGVNFGEEIDMKKVDFRNPKGFYENEKIFKVLRSMLNQAGVRDEFGEKSSLDAKGFLKRLGRAFSRVRLQKELSILSKSSSWGLKSFPILFYYLKPYLPKSTKLVGVYRHPLAVAESFMKAWEGGRYSFEQVIELWSKANRDMLYHLSGKDSMLICYEDLFIPEKSEKILQTIKDFVGGSVPLEEIKKNIDQSLNRSSKKVEELAKHYTLSTEALATLESLEKMKV